jgi:uncharacterized repeat protein (TIGR01451 family)
LCILLQTGVAYAGSAGKRDVDVSLQQFKVSKHAQAEVLEVADRVKPGEVIEYQVTYRNTSNHLVRQLQATLPIPVETEYLPNTAHPQGVQASVDGVIYAPVPLHRPVKLANGQVEEREVPVSEYRSLRWVLGDLPANQKTTVSARVRLAPLGKAGMEGAKK